MFFHLSERARRRRAVRDLERRMAELDRLDREHGLGTMPTAVPRRQRRQHGALFPGLLVSALVLTLVIALSPNENFRAVRRLLGFDNDRLAAAPPVDATAGSYAFIQTQLGSDEPVGYDPCRPIEVLVNPTGAPRNHQQLIDTGLERVEAATGLVFTRVGTTDKITHTTSPYPRRQPVIIAWATPEQVPDLEGTVAGVAGSLALDQGGRLRYVTGHVHLDRDLFASFGFSEQPAAQAIMDHELGHLVGLDHVDDTGELMHPSSSIRTSFGPGDLAGLARIGNIDC